MNKISLLLSLLFISMIGNWSMFSQTYNGKSTWYNYEGVGGTCSIPYPSNTLTAALNQEQYGLADFCGACAEVTNKSNNKKVIVRIDDKCPGCPYGGLDLEKKAFEQISSLETGVIDVEWKLISCPINNKIGIFFKDGSTRYWAYMQIRNHKNKVKKVSYRLTGDALFLDMERTNDNYFKKLGVGSMLGAGPFDFRITDDYNNTVTILNIPLQGGQVANTNEQFPEIDGGGDSSGNQSPYGGTPQNIPGKIEAENYDLGGANVAFNDSSTDNEGGVYRDDAVGIEVCSEGGHNIGWTKTGEWLEYTVNVSASKTYTLESRVATTLSEKKFHIEVDGQDISGQINVPNTGGWQNWQTVTTSVTLNAGLQVLRIVMDSDDFNLNNLIFKNIAPPTNQPPTVEVTSPQRNTHYSEGLTLNITANADDTDGSVTKVEFFVDNTKISEDTSAPYTANWTTIVGNHSIKAVAIDNDTATTSSIVDITVQSDPQSPYGGTPQNIPGKIEAENYDIGGANVAFNDSSTDNEGGVYRDDAVGIEVCSEGGHNIGWTKTGEWLEYTVNVSASKTYTLESRVATTLSEKKFHIEVDGQDISGQINVPNTGGWQNWQTVTTSVALNAGLQVLRIVMDSDDFNLNNLIFKNIEPSTNQPPTVEITSPQKDTSYSEGLTLNITANANDTDGSVTKVEFFVDNTKISEDTSAPYTANWTTIIGNHSIKAIAIDNDNATTSSIIDITVQTGDTILSEAQYNEFFPYRFGTDLTTYELDPDKDFYTYQAFTEAIARMNNIEITFERREGTNLYRLTRKDKQTNQLAVIRTDQDFNASWNQSKPITTQVIDYGSFANEGGETVRKRELAAFLANIAQETTGGWDTAPGGRYSWGLYFREEQGYEGTDLIGYRDESNTSYPPAPGKSYHGRGPIQLSYNYNYGQVSEFLFGDKNVLINNPEQIVQDGALAFQTAIWFWMTPQFPKPSAHDVMVGNWTPTPYDQERNRKSGFGMTINIINGGVECGSGTEINKVIHRIGHYNRFAGIVGVNNDLDTTNDCSECGCAQMTPFNGIEPESRTIISTQTLTPVVVNVYPNPFSNTVSFSFELHKKDNVSIHISNFNGESLGKELKNEPLENGTYTFSWDTSNFPKGMYLYKVTIGKNTKIFKMMKF